ncbi:MAG: hypothetical protein FJW30_00010 [Acidobacteria bacterium]|nr:hypothetical protein [Acidobacteriota bacterium]
MWMLLVFLLAQAVPLVALGITDGAKGMECCRRGGKNSHCCKRKAVSTTVGLQAAGSGCHLPCCGVPSHSAPSLIVPAQPAYLEDAPVSEPVALRVTPSEARVSAGVDPSLYQRPPPIFIR